MNEVDGNHTLWLTPGDGTTELYHQGKIRGPGFDPVNFKLEVIEDKLKDARGRSMPTVVAKVLGAWEYEELRKQLNHDENRILVILLDCAPLSIGEIAKEAGWYYADSMPDRSRAQRRLGKLYALKFAKKNKRSDKAELTTEGKEEAERLKKEGDLFNGK
jgi:hypothetical protein